MPHKEGVTDILTFYKNGNARTLGNVFMDGMQIMEFILKHVKNVVRNNLEMSSMPVDAIDIFAFHQANILICGFGTGLSCASGVVDLSRTEIFEPVEI